MRIPSWGHWVVLALIIVVSGIFHLLYFAPLVSQPSPIYGGDYFFQQGSILHIANGGNPFVSAHITEGGPWFSVGYSALVGYTAMILGLEVFTAMKFWSIIALALGTIIFYFAARRIFPPYVSVAVTPLFVITASYPIMKYSTFTAAVWTPLLLWCFLYHRDTKSWKSATYTGVVAGLTVISHGVGIVIAMFWLGLFAVLEFVEQRKKVWKKGKLLPWLQTTGGRFALIFILLFMIGLLYWWFPITSGFTNYADSNSWAATYNATYSLNIQFLFKTVIGLFFEFGSVYGALRSLLMLAGVGTLFLIQNKRIKYVGIGLLAVTAITFTHQLVLYPLGIYLSHEKMVQFFVPTLFPIISGMFLYYLYKAQKLFFYGALVFIFIVFAYHSSVILESERTNRFYQNGERPIDPSWQAFADFAEENLDVNTVILSNNEVSFAANGVTGIKAMQNRRAHNWPYVNMDRRYLDAALMLYGQDNAVRQELLDAYEIEYLLWHIDWITTDFYLDQQGQVADYQDPILLPAEDVYGRVLSNANISFSYVENGYLDPSLRRDDVKTYPLFVILPAREQIDRPWHAGLDAWLVPEFTYGNPDSPELVLYRIDRQNVLNP